MNLLDGIASRASALKIIAPGPSRDQIGQLLRAAARAPDHGRLRPWRFIVMEGPARERFGDAIAAMMRSRMPDATQEQLDGARAKALRAPTVIVVAAKITRGKIPEIEQVAAVAAAIQNLCLAAHAMGIGAMWKTGPAAYDTNIKEMFGLEPADHIVGFVYLGTIATAGTAGSASIDDVTRWL